MDDKEFSSINVIPFIDIILVLLTIVLTTSTFIARGSIPVTLPRVSSSQSELLKTHTIEIDKQGHMFLNARQIWLPELKNELANVNPGAPVLIRADKDIPLQTFVDVLDAVKTLGFKSVSLQTEVKSGRTPAGALARGINGCGAATCPPRQAVD